MTATPPRADLRTLAAEAIDAAIDATGREHGDPQPNGEELVDAVLAAVLPAISDVLLAQRDRLAGKDRWSGRRRGLEEAAGIVRRLAAAAPPVGVSAPVPTERGQAGQRAEEGFDYDPGTPEERARYWKQRAETAWERGDEDALVITRLVRDQIRVQTALCWDVIEAAKAWRVQFEKPDDIKWPRRAALIAAVDALRDAGPHQHECACNRNWGGPCGPCVCEEPPRQGVWRLTCGAGNIPPNQTYATRGAAEDVMRLHDGACPGTHGVEFVPDADVDQTEDDRG